MMRNTAPKRHWSESSLGSFRTSETHFGPYLLAAYGQHRRYCWEVARVGRRRRIIAEGIASSLAAAQAAAEEAASHHLAAAPPGAARGLPPAPETRH